MKYGILASDFDKLIVRFVVSEPLQSLILKIAEFLYFVGTQSFYFGIRVAAFFNEKAKQSIAGRAAQKEGGTFKVPPSLVGAIWFHCASLGEFEQGRSLIEKIKREHPGKKILLTFFSPSGYEIRKEYEQVDFVCYLPFDSPKNARQFLDAVQPSMAIFVKYEFWHFYLKNLKECQIPTVLISAVFRKEQVFFRWYGTFFRKMLDCFSQIFVQEETSANLLKINRLDIVLVAGDTRIDRVLNIASAKKTMPEIEAFCGRKKVLVVGSSWQPDEEILLPFFNQKLPNDWKIIIAPHEIGETHLKQIEHGLKLPFVRYSNFEKGKKDNFRVLIIDNIGMLSSLYRFGKIAYIGGGFGSGIHNTLEPIAHGLPVIFGPKYQKFSEAVELVKTGGGFSIKNEREFEDVLTKLFEEENLRNASEKARFHVEKNQGATELIFRELGF